jgi:hypothetical protein
MTEFKEFAKIPRLNRECIITEKIDGTNSSITITEDGQFLVGSRNRFITSQNDNYGFAKWAHENKEELMKLGVGTHYGEWWGQGVQRGYDMNQKVFSLFNTSKWSDDNIRPKCCRVVPVLYSGLFSTDKINEIITQLKFSGSAAAPGYNRPEGIIIFHTALNGYFKVTIEHDDQPKSKVN